MAFKAYQKARFAQYDLIVNGIKDEQDTSNQIKLVKQVIVSEIIGMVIAPADSKALVPLIKKAIDVGIIAVNIDNKLDDAALKERASWCRSSAPITARARINAQQRTLGFQDAMKAAGVNVVSV